MPNTIPPILPVKDVPDELIRVINERLRLIESGEGGEGPQELPGGAEQNPIIGFVINQASPGFNIGPMLAAPLAGSVRRCVVVTKASDSSTPLTFLIRQNGASIFATNPSVAGGALSGSVSVFTTMTAVPLPVALHDVFSIDITSGSNNWLFTTQLE